MDTSAVRRTAATFVTNTTGPPAPRHRRLRRGRFDLVEVADLITALICFTISNAWLITQNSHHHGGHGQGALALVAAVTSAPLVLRTRFPLSAWVASALAIIGTVVVITPGSFSSSAYPPAAVVVYFLCVYAVTVRCRPRIVVAIAVATVVAATVIDAGTTAGAIFLTAIPLLLGVLVRTRRSSRKELAEQERRHSGERALLEERQRIARELHDVVAHHMSVIAIQAEAAPYKAADPPPEMVECFGEIRASALTGLAELRRVLGVLRTGGPDTAPRPGLADLDALLGSARSGGVSVHATTTGHPVALPEGVDLSAYRILQEALSNAMRHAPGSHAEVHLTYRPDTLHLDVRNDPTPRAAGPDGAGGKPNGNGPGGNPLGHPEAADGGGHGLIGMRERAAMLGGKLVAGPTSDGGFRVTALLPLGDNDRDGAT